MIVAGGLGKFKPVLVQSLQMARVVNYNGSRNYKPLQILAKNYLENLCKIDRENPIFSIKYCFDYIAEFKRKPRVERSVQHWCEKNRVVAKEIPELLEIVEEYSNRKV